jgi:hypothetical protein
MKGISTEGLAERQRLIYCMTQLLHCAERVQKHVIYWFGYKGLLVGRRARVRFLEKPTPRSSTIASKQENYSFNTYFGTHPMALKRTSAIPELRLTQRALQRHAKAPANRPKTLRTRGQAASSEMDNSFPSTDPEGVVQMEEMDQIPMDPEQRRDLLAAFSKDPEFFDVADTVKAPVRESIDLIDTRPAYAQPCFLPPPSASSITRAEHTRNRNSLVITDAWLANHSTNN